MDKNIISIRIDRLEVYALVDTGAAVTVMSESLRRKLNKVVTPWSVKYLRSVGQHLLTPIGLCTARVALENQVVPVEFVILNSCTYDVILGLDFLRSNGALINCATAEFSIFPFPSGSYKDEPQSVDHTGSLTLNSTVKIPPQTAVRVQSSMSLLSTLPGFQDLGDIMAEPNESLRIQKGVTFPRCLTTLSNGTTDLWLVNTGLATQILPAGLTVASFSTPPSWASVNAVPEVISGNPAAPVNGGPSPTIAPASVFLGMIDSKLPVDQQTHLLALLETYSHIFDIDKSHTRHTSCVKHSIDTEGRGPVRQKPYRVSLTERRAIQQQVQDMLKDDVIETSCSPWASPVVLVRKKDNSWRFCVDYRRLNKITKRDTYPMPRIDDTLDSLQGAKFFSSIDMRSGYWQIEVDPRDAEKTAFVTPDGLYQFKVMPFGLCNAPATFERMIDNVLGNLKWTSCLCYLDDVVVFASTFDEHNHRLRQVLACMSAAGLTLNHKKCRFGYKELTVLGHLVSSDGIRPDPNKIAAVTNFPKPTTIKTVRSFLGLCSYFRRFVRNFAHKARPLQCLLKKGVTFHWNLEHEAAFTSLKSALSTHPILRHFDPDAPSELHTDASGIGLGAVLTQRPDDTEHPVSFASRTLSPAEMNYSTTEKECLAVVWAISKFRPYLYGHHFKVVTDHHALCWLANIKAPSGKLARWALQLQEYDYEVVYRAGRKHQDADALSRSPISLKHMEPEDSPVATTLCIIDDLDLPSEQRRDPVLRNIIDILGLPGPLTQQQLKQSRNFTLQDSVLCKKNFDPFGRPHLLVIPQQLRHDVLRHFHNDPTAGHLGFSRTYDRIIRRFFWPGMRRSISNYVRSCVDCQRRKHQAARPQGQLQSIPPPNVPFSRVGVDLLGPFPPSQNGNRWIIVCIDHHTRYAETKALPTGTAPDIATFLLEQVILRHGAPRELLSDRGAAFLSTVVRELLNACNTVHRTTTSYHPQCNGLTERLNRTLCDMLCMYIDTAHSNWDTILPFITYAYNTSRQDTTTFTPFFLVFARDSETMLDTLLPYIDNGHSTKYMDEMMGRAEESRQLARTYTLLAQEKQQLRYDEHHRPATYAPGQLVLLWKPERRVGLSEKLMHRYFGPYEVTRQVSPVNYEVRLLDPDPSRSRRRQNQDIVHVLRMKPYHPPPSPTDVAS